MKNILKFDTFVTTLQPTNRTLSFYVNWQKMPFKQR